MKAVILLVAFAAAAFAQNAQSTDFGADLNNLDFASIIGGPLNAVVEAQAAAAQQTSTFIQGVGFTADPSNPKRQLVRTVEFNYFSVDQNGSDVTRSMSVPFLYMIPIPFIQVDSVSIDLNVQLSSVQQVDTTVSTNSQYNENQWSAAWGWGYVTVRSMSGSIASQSQTTASTKVQENYSLQVSVQASQASLPGGMERLLDLFESIVVQDAAPLS